MPRSRSIPSPEVLERAMHAFWHSGYEATSMAELVERTGSTRQSIYADFGSKEGLYTACFAHYRDKIVRPAIRPLADQDLGMGAIEAYFETQIALAEEVGLPGPGCLVGNAMTETAPANPRILECVKDHNLRLHSAFSQALPSNIGRARCDELAGFLVVAAQGLWAMSRVEKDAHTLRQRAKTILRMIKNEVSDDA